MAEMDPVVFIREVTYSPDGEGYVKICAISGTDVGGLAATIEAIAASNGLFDDYWREIIGQLPRWGFDVEEIAEFQELHTPEHLDLQGTIVPISQSCSCLSTVQQLLLSFEKVRTAA